MIYLKLLTNYPKSNLLDAIEYIHTKFNRFRQIVQLINQMEIFSKDNNITEINMEVISQII